MQTLYNIGIPDMKTQFYDMKLLLATTSVPYICILKNALSYRQQSAIFLHTVSVCELERSLKATLQRDCK